MALRAPLTFDVFLSFEWKHGLLPAHLLCAALANAPAPLRVWFALEQDAASPSEMSSGVAASAVFCFLATDGALLKPNVRHEVASAVAEGRRLVLLREAAGPPLEALLAQLDAPGDALADQAAGRRHLGLEAAAAFKAAARAAPCLEYTLDASLVGVTAPQLQRAVEAVLRELALPLRASASASPLARPFRMRALRPQAGHCDALLVAASDGQRQALTLQEGARALCGKRELVTAVLPAGCSAEAAAEAVGRAGAVVLLLTGRAWGEVGFCAAAAAALAAHKPVATVHEKDALFGGVPVFDDFFRAAQQHTQALIVASSDCGEQARALQVHLARLQSASGAAAVPESAVLPAGCSEAEAMQAVGQAAAVVLLVSPGFWGEPGCRAAVGAALTQGKLSLVRTTAGGGFEGLPDLQEALSRKSGVCATPKELLPVYSAGGVAVELARPAAKARLMLEEVLVKMGAERVAKGRCLPPPLPVAYDPAPVAVARAAAASALTASPRPAAVVLGGRGGAGKTTLASSLALDEGVTAGFDSVAWVTVGKVDHAGMVSVLVTLLEELEPHGAAAPVATDPLAAALERLRAVLARRAVLLVVDDVWAAAEWQPDAAKLLCAAVSVAPEGGGGASCVLFTCRGADVYQALGGAGGVAADGRAILTVPMEELEPAVAAAYLRKGAGLTAALDVSTLLNGVGRLPLALTLAAAYVRAAMDVGASEEEAVAAAGEELADREGVALEERGVRAGEWLASAAFWAALESVHPHCREYAPTYRALQGVLRAGFARRYWSKFVVWGLLKEDEYLSEAALGVLWGCKGEETRALLTQMQCAGLVKWEENAGRAMLHDLAHDFAAAMVQVGRGGKAGAAAAAVDRCAGLLLEEGEVGVWWRQEVGGMLRVAERGAEGTELVWGLQWLIRGVRERGAGRVAKEVGLQMAWEREQGQGRLQEFTQMKLLHQMLVMAVGALEGEEGPGNVAPHVIGRLSGLEGGRIARLLQEAWGWDGEGKAWLRPVRPNFPQPGGACEGVMEGHTSWVICLCSLGDGRIVSGSGDATLRVWDAASGVCVGVLQGHTGEVSSVCALDGGRIVSGSDDKTVRVWEAATGVCVRVLEGHTDVVNSVCALGDEHTVSGSSDCSLRVWQALTGVCLQVLRGHADLVRSVCVLTDGRIASGSTDFTVRVWDAASGACVRVLEGHTSWVMGVCTLSDGRIASGSGDKTVRVWDAASGVCAHVLQGHEDMVSSVCDQGDGRIVSGSVDTTARVWDAATGECVRVLEDTSRIWSVCALGDGRIVSGSNDGAVRVWDATKGLCARALEGHKGWIRCLCAVDGGRIVSGSEDKTLRVWDAATGMCMHVLQGHTHWVESVCALANGCIVSGSKDKTLRVWDPATGECVRALEGHTGEVGSVCTLGSERIVSGSKDGTVRVWDAATGGCTRVLEGHTGGVSSVCALGDVRIASGSGDATIRVWDAATGTCGRVLEGHTSGIFHLWALWGEDRIASWADNNTLRIWDAATGVSMRVLEGHTGWVKNVCALGDGRIVSRGDDGRLRVWSVATGVCLETCDRQTSRAVQLSLLTGDRVASAYFHHGRTATHFSPLGVQSLYLCREARKCIFTTLPSGARHATVFAAGGATHTLEFVTPSEG